MGRIARLDPQEIQKIAAGQVVERPANVVKELVENSLDAGATTITITIVDGGKKLIRVTDNGCGMEPDDALLCFEHHTTSKLTSVGDLPHLQTFGFRGEALSTITAVSHCTITTKQAHDQLGTKLTLQGGKLGSTETIPAATGTDIIVEDVLYNVPARKKFLRATDTESRQITTLFHAFCLAYPQVHFTLNNSGHITNCPPTNSLQNRVAQLWHTPDIPALHSLGDVGLPESPVASGVISHYLYGRFDRSWMFFFVNGRWVKNYTLARAVMNGYANVLPQGKYPIAVINITVDPHEVDINVHPRKEELLFAHPKKVEQAICESVKRTLEGAISRTIDRSYPSTRVFNPPSGRTEVLDSLPFLSETPTFQARSPRWSEASREVRTEQEIPRTDNYQLIGQLHKTYLLLEHEDGLLIIDQHAAHERILYEKFDSKFTEIASTQLLFPEIVQLPAADCELLAQHLPLLKEHGFAVEQVGPQQLGVTATPVLSKSVNLKELLSFLATELTSIKALDNATVHRIVSEKLRAQMACKTAVKAGDVLDQQHMHQLLEDLNKTPNRFSCPHGRPTSWLISKYDIEKKFHRVG